MTLRHSGPPSAERFEFGPRFLLVLLDPRSAPATALSTSINPEYNTDNKTESKIHIHTELNYHLYPLSKCLLPLQPPKKLIPKTPRRIIKPHLLIQPIDLLYLFGRKFEVSGKVGGETRGGFGFGDDDVVFGDGPGWRRGRGRGRGRSVRLISVIFPELYVYSYQRGEI